MASLTLVIQGLALVAVIVLFIVDGMDSVPAFVLLVFTAVVGLPVWLRARRRGM